MANIEKLKEQARKFEQKEQWAKALDVLVRAVEEFEKSPDSEADLALYNRVGDLYVRLNDSTNAVQYYERAADRYMDAGLVNNAIALCNKVMRLSPGRSSTYLKLGMLFAKKGFMAEARQNLLEYADRMQKGGQLEEAFRALKKFAEMTPGQGEIWATLAQQARAQAKTPEQAEQVEKLLQEFEAKDKVVQQRRSRMSRSMITGELIPEEAPKSSSELIFLDVDDVPVPGRRSGGVAAPPAPVAEAEAEPPPAPEIAPLEIEPTSLVEEAAQPDIPPLELEPTSLVEPEPVAGLETGDVEAGAGASLDLEPTSLTEEPPVLESLPTALSPAEPEVAPAEPEAEEPAPEAAGADEFGVIEFAPELAEPEPVGPGADLPLLDVEEGAELPLLDTGVELEMAEEAVESGASLEFLDLGTVAPAAAPTVEELEARLAASPEDWGLRRQYAEALLEKGERERGLAELDASLEGFEQAEDLHGASDVVEEFLRLEPNSVRHQQKRVELAFRSGDRQRLVGAYVELADALLRSNEPDKALAVYHRVLEHDPGNVRARTAVETLAPPAPPEAEPAARVSRPAAVPVPADEGEYVDLGAFLLDEEAPKDTRMRIEDEEPTGDEQKDFQQMLAAFKKGIEANVEETDFQSHYDLGVAYKEMGLLDEAIAEFQKALRAPEGKLKASEALGVCFFEKGQFSVAETILRRGLEQPAASDAERVGLLYWLGRTLEEQHKAAEALEAYNRVFAVDINFQDVNARVRALAKAGV
jgi:tetratricopeptide (TPR) repeat protein